MGRTLLAQDVAARTPMERLLAELGFRIDTRSRRAACILHGGDNRTAFSWTDGGLWYCHACGKGGDKLHLVMAARGCDFKGALKFLAALAGFELADSHELRDALAQRRRERARLEVAAAWLQALEHDALLACADEVHRLEAIRRNVEGRLAAISRGDPERFIGEAELAWSALKYVADEMPLAAAAYTVIAFDNELNRAQFVLRPEEGGTVAAEALLSGGITDDRGRLFEVLL